MKSPFTEEQQQVLAAWTTHYPYPVMGLLMAMRQVQDWHRCVTPEDETYLAGLFKTDLRRVHEVATFYPAFTAKPTGRKRLGLCKGLSCHMKGSGKMAGHLEKKLGVKEGETTKDGEYSFETMQCLGACDCGPALIVNDELQGTATEALIDKLLAEKR